MPRPIPVGLPPCSDAAHAGAIITRRGTYGLHDRPLYQCRRKRAGTIHTFSAPSAQFRRRFRYSNEDIAHALWLVGRGTSYFGAAIEVRERAGRKESLDNNLVVTWLDRFGPAIFDELRPRPARIGTVVLDSSPFNIKTVGPDGEPVAGGELRFVVFGAARERKGKSPVVLLLKSAWRKDSYAWRAFLKDVPGDADRIICDGESTIQQTSRVRWPDAKLSISAWHVLKRGEDILTTAKLHSRKKPYYKALRRCLKSARNWRAFVQLARRARVPALENWIGDVEDVIGPQLRRRDRPTSTGAIETKLGQIKKHISLQRGTYRTLPRLDITLGLMTLWLNRRDSETEYARIIATAR